MFTQHLLRGAKGNGAFLLYHPWGIFLSVIAQSSDIFCRIISSNSLLVCFSPFPLFHSLRPNLSPAVGKVELVPDYPIAEAKKTIAATHCENIFLYYHCPDTDFITSHCISDMRIFFFTAGHSTPPLLVERNRLHSNWDAKNTLCSFAECHSD